MATSPFKPMLFHPFRAMLEQAAANGHRIEPVNKQAWNKYLRDHKIPIGGLMVYGQSLSETIRPVIISGAGEQDGLYFWSPDEEVVAKFVPPTPPAGAAPAPASDAPPAEAPPPEAPPPADPPPAGDAPAA
ncbi:MAG: hypothetical protein H6809_01360 [Phycisphaeraceae bacterium]|nr:hypothetical protein [Phycisphaeraceae bacterium]